jgi:hypothetical protein
VDNWWNSAVPRVAVVPSPLAYKPFLGSKAVAAGLLTKRQLAGPSWRRLFRDVYVSAGVPVDRITMCLGAALLLPPGGALSHESAAIFHNVAGLEFSPAQVSATPVSATPVSATPASATPASATPASAVRVSVPPGCRLQREGGLVVHRVRLDPGEVVRRGGVPVTSPARTAFDLGSGPDLVSAVVALDALLYQRIIRLADLPAIQASRSHSRGSRRFRAAAALARADVESPMETRTRLVLVLGGLPEPSIQCLVRDRAGSVVARLDLAYEALRIGIEYDGDHHRERDTFRRDAVRLNRLRLLGWTILRFTADDVIRDPARVLTQVCTAISQAIN